MLHFSEAEFATRLKAVEERMQAAKLDALILFAPESQYWLTGHDTFGYCFFQCLVIGGPEPVLLTRSADLRQAQLTSNIKDIRIWKDQQNANPAQDLQTLLVDLGLSGKRLGIDLDTHGLTGLNLKRIQAEVMGQLFDASDLVSKLRLIKSPAEIAYVKRAGALADAALDAAMPLIKAGGYEGEILAAMQGEIMRHGGDYPANEFIIGSAENALLCRYHTGRRKLDKDDQITLEWAGAYRHYHAAMMRTAVIGKPKDKHFKMQEAAEKALQACEGALKAGQPMADVFTAHAKTLDGMGMGKHRLNACGYALGARFSPSWMEREMFYEGADTIMQENMVFFLHMILMDSESGAAMCLGRTSLITANGAESLSRHSLDMIRG